MANIPENLKYSKDHEWILVEDDIATIGITDYAQDALGDVVYVELPNEGENFDVNDEFGSVESVKAVSEIFTPVAGQVVEFNKEINDKPEIVNDDPYGDAWLIKIKMDNPKEIDVLLSAEEYADFLEAEEE